MNFDPEISGILSENILNSMREALLILDDSMHVVSANRAFYRLFKVNPGETENRLIFDLGNGQWDIPELRHLLENIIPKQNTIEDFEVQHTFEQIGPKVMMLNARRIMRKQGAPGLILLIIEDITERYAFQKRLAESEAQYHKLVENINSVIIGIDESGYITFFNSFSEKLFQFNRHETIGKPFVGHIVPVKDSRGQDNSRLIADIISQPDKFYSAESEGMQKSGGRVRFSWSALVLRDSEGDVKEILIDGNDVTEFSEIRSQYERKSNLLDSLLDFIPEGIMITDERHELVQVSRNMSELLGVPAERILHTNDKSLLKLLHLFWTDGRPINSPGELPLTKAVETGKRYDDYEIMLEENGSSRVLMVNAAPFRDADGQVIGAIGAWRDITTRKDAEEKLRESEATLNAVLEAMPVGVIIADTSGKVTRINNITREIWGVPPETTSWEQYGEWVGWWPQTGQRIKADEWAMARTLHTGEEVRGDLVQIQKFGSSERLFCLNNSVPLKDVNGKIIGGVVAMIDVTKLRTVEEELRKSEEKFSKAFHLSPLALSLTTAEDSKINEINEAYCRLTGYSREELIGHTTIELGITTKEKRQAIIREYAPQGRVYLLETQIRNKSGQERDVILSADKLDLHGVTHYLMTAMDITERKKAEKELQERSEELASANSDLESFSYSVSHDLRNPLSVIGNFASILLEDYSDKLDTEGKEYLSRMFENVKKMQRLINDMLSLSRTSRQELKREDVNLSEMVCRYLDDLHSLDPQRKTDCQVEHDMHAFADPDMLHLAFENLLRNAWKFTSTREVTRIEVGCIIQDQQKVYFVKDNGVGFEMQFAEKIFEPFKRVHSEKEFGGTGVGLSIVQRVISRHRGRVWAEGEKDKGATFYFTLG